ncbi:hypothetical protein PsAD2_04617 [Pseudovibrio axinellae]|uniref:Uncharacterized protein n=1 Tax=Pseudovibrio axinellae TaxID=989403 RepID=A0A161X7C1_9HYPH|nr:hypothetical protein [Pseudovibrio axinellae]KZL04534.1 hypothetical protein PsAD2_04617 [Pseudovibrio axinellae]SEQ74037.1 hypothetical protein SAMN05421798_10491 [Pseudovibrio axinellae]
MLMTSETVFRDHVVEGDPSSGEHDVKKSEVRELLKNIALGVSAGGGVAAQAASDLPVSVEPNDPRTAIVWGEGEGDEALNGIWNYIADKWVQIHSFTGVYDQSSAQETVYAAVFADRYGNLVVGVRHDGSIYIPKLSVGTINADPVEPDEQSEWSTLSVANSDTVVVVGDSYSAGIFNLQDKAYISNLSAMSPFRFRNFSLGGDSALDMQHRIINKTAYVDGTVFTGTSAKYAVVATYTNDVDFRDVDLNYYLENLRRLVEVIQAAGVEPILCSEFPASADTVSGIRQISREYGIEFIDCQTLNREIGTLDVGPFHQGHPGTRTNGVFWLPILEHLRQLKPDNSIKIYRKRDEFTASDMSELLYTGEVGRYRRFKELSVSHYRLNDSNKERFEQLDAGDIDSPVFVDDEYMRLENGEAVTFDDFALIEATLDGTAKTIEALRLIVSGSTGVSVYVRDWLDIDAAIPGKKQGTLPTTPEYLEKWDQPRGAWRDVGSGLEIELLQADLVHSMNKDCIQFLLYKSGGFDLHDVEISYKGGGKNKSAEQLRLHVSGEELVGTQTVATSDLAAWTQTGSPNTLTPIDVYNAPCNPLDINNPVSEVCEITATDTLSQTVVLAAGAAEKRYILTVWARYFPSAYLDNSIYGLDPAQVIDSSEGGVDFDTHSLITQDTADVRTLVVEYSHADSLPATGGVRVSDFAALCWRGVEIPITLLPEPLGRDDFTFKLSCPDGVIQIAKVSMREAK